MFEQRAQVAGELFPVFPILRFGVVGAEGENDDLRREAGQLLELRKLPVGEVTVLKQGRAADAKISYVEARAEQFAEDDGVTVVLAIFDPSAKGDAITDAGDANGALVIGGMQGRFARVGATGHPNAKRDANAGKEQPFHSLCTELFGE